MFKTAIERPVRLWWIVGNCIWCPLILVLWWHAYESQTFAQASLTVTWLEAVSSIGVLWSVIGAVWLAKLRKTRRT